MSFWGGNFAKAEGNYGDAVCEEAGSHWSVDSVDEGLATIVVNFNHYCRHTDGSRTPAPSNDTSYYYEVSVDAVDEEEARDEIEDILGDAYNIGQLVDLLNNL